MKRAFCLIAFSAFLSANDAVVYEYPDGLTVEPMGSERVQMLAETVSVLPVEGFKVRVKANFYLKNLSEKRTRLSVGFPFRPLWGESREVLYSRDLKSQAELIKKRLNLVSKVNGETVKVRFKLSREGERLLWAVWKVSWEPGEVKVLETEYTTRWSRWQDVMGFFGYYLEYITETGAGWAGKIGEALVKFRIPSELPKQGVSWKSAVIWQWSPGGKLLGDTVIVWEFKDWEPEENLSFSAIGVSHGVPWLVQSLAESLWLNGLPQNKGEIVKLIKRTPQPPPLVVQLVINLAFARDGHAFEDPQWKALEDLLGYEPSGKLSYDQLSPQNKRIVSAALEVKDSLVKLYRENSKSPYFAEIYMLPYLLMVNDAEEIVGLRKGKDWRRVLKTVLERAGKDPPKGYEGAWWVSNAQWVKSHRDQLEELLRYASSGS